MSKPLSEGMRDTILRLAIEKIERLESAYAGAEQLAIEKANEAAVLRAGCAPDIVELTGAVAMLDTAAEMLRTRNTPVANECRRYADALRARLP